MGFYQQELKRIINYLKLILMDNLTIQKKLNVIL